MTNNVKEHLKAFGFNPDANNSDGTDDDTPPNYVMVCHECGHQITRDRACDTTRKAKTGEISWKDCGHQIYFTRNAIDGLRDEDILEAAKNLDTAHVRVEAESFERLQADVAYEDENGMQFLDITFWGFSDEAELEEDEDGYFPFNRGLLSMGYDKTDDSEFIEPTITGMTKTVNEDLGSERTRVQLLELSQPTR